MSRFVDCDADGATIESWVVGDDGEQIGLAADRSDRLDLQRHAAFPVTGTTVTESLELGFGRFACRVYSRDGGRVSCSPPPCPGCRSATRSPTAKVATR